MRHSWNEWDDTLSTYSSAFNPDEFYADWAAEHEEDGPSEEDIKEAIERAEERERDQQVRFRAIAAVYEKADRILTLDPVSVALVTDANAPAAWSDGQNISLNTKILRNYEDRDIVSLHGTNYHELCHILYTPRQGSVMGKWVMEKNYMTAFNILEDQRIETLFAARYPSTRVFLEASTMRYVIETAERPEDVAMIHLLIHGRRFVDYELRKEAYQICAEVFGLDTAKTFAEIIDEYRTLAFPSDVDRGMELIERLQLLLMRLGQSMQSKGCGNDGPLKKGRPEPGSAQKRDAMNSEGDGKPVKPEDLSDSDGEGTGEPDSNYAGDDDKYADQSKTRDDETRARDNRLSDRANDILDQLADTPQAHKETKEFRKAVRVNEFSTGRLKKQNFEDSRVHAYAKNAANTFGETLRQIEEEADPTWLYEQPSGKLNTTRAMHADVNDLNRLFDRWYEGDDATVIEAAILLDRSGSMAYRLSEAAEAMWIIKRGLEKIDARVTAYTFCEYSRLLYSADELASPSTFRRPPCGGSTNPLRGLEEVEMIMEMSKRPTKIVFMVTDGYWDGNEASNRVVARMNDNGVLTVLVYIGDLNWLEEEAERGSEYAMRQLRELTHGAKVVRAIKEPKDLVPLAQRIVTTYLKQKIER